MNARRTLWLLGVVTTSHFTAFSMALTLMPLVAVSLGASPIIVGALGASLFLIPMVLGVQTGTWVDRFGPRTTLVTSSLLLGLSPISVLLFPSIATLFTMEVLLGLANLTAVVAGQALTARIGKAEHREAHFGWFTTFVAGGQMVGPLCAGLIAGWRGYLPALDMITGLALIPLAVTWWLPNPRAQLAGDYVNRSLTRELNRAISLLSIASVQVAVISTFSVSFAKSVFLSFFPIILQAAGFSPSVIGAILALRALISAILRPFLPTITQLLGDRRRALIFMVGLTAISLGGIGFSQALAVIVAASTLAGIAMGLAPPLSLVMVVGGAAGVEVGFALGVRFTINQLAKLIGPLTIGVVAEIFSLQIGFLACGALIASSLGYLRIPGMKLTDQRPK